MSKNTLYLECYEGITGKMVLEALKELAGGLEAEEGSMQGEILTQIDSLMETLQIEKITASPSNAIRICSICCSQSIGK